jgi:protoheme IX farnesyltransferase
LLALLTLLTYLFLYTPLKRLTPYATVVGAIPGALPPVIGWSAVRGELGLEAASLFAILFFWQIPHFLSLAWMYRNDYERAGYRLLTVVDRAGRITGRQVFIYAAALVPASILPTYAGLLGKGYFFGAGLISLAFLGAAVLMARKPTPASARRLFLASLVYIPALIGLMILDRI